MSFNFKELHQSRKADAAMRAELDRMKKSQGEQKKKEVESDLDFFFGRFAGRPDLIVSVDTTDEGDRSSGKQGGPVAEIDRFERAAEIAARKGWALTWCRHGATFCQLTAAGKRQLSRRKVDGWAPASSRGYAKLGMAS